MVLVALKAVGFVALWLVAILAIIAMLAGAIVLARMLVKLVIRFFKYN